MAEGAPIKELFAELGYEFNTAVLERGGEILDRLLGAVERVADSLDGFGAAAGDVEAPVDKASDAVEELTEKAKESESVVDSFGKRLLQFAAVKAAFSWIQGVAGETDRLVTRFGLLAGQAATLRTAARGNAGEIASWEKALESLSRESDTGLANSWERLKDFADELAGIPDPAKRAAMAQKVLGGEAVKLLPVLERGARGIEDLESKTKALGGGFSGPGAEGLLAFNNLMGDFATVGESLFVRVLEKVASAFEGFSTTLEDITGPIFKVIDNSRILEVTLGALAAAAIYFGVQAAWAWIVATWPALLFVAAIAAIVLIIEDLIVGMEGGESAIGDFIDAIFGAGAAAAVFDKIRAAWEWLSDAFMDRVELIKNIFTDLLNLWSGGPSVIGDFIDSLLGIGAAQAIIDGIKNAFATVWGWMEKIGGFAIRILKPAFKAIFGNAGNVADAVTGQGAVRGLNERFRSRHGEGPALEASPREMATRSAKVESEQTLNVNVNRGVSDREMTELARRTIQTEMERHARDVEDALTEVA